MRVSQRRPTPRQLTFARSYLWTGSAAKAAREAGYTGRFAAQAGYKLLKRAGTRAAINELLELERTCLRRQVLRGIRKVDAAVRGTQDSLPSLDTHAALVVWLMQRMGLDEERSCRALTYWVHITGPRLRKMGLMGGQENGKN